MAVKLRLSRQGAKKHPQYLVVAVDSTKKRDGQYLENLGHYFPLAQEWKDKVKLNLPAIQAWIDRGAQPSQTVSQLIRRAGA